MDIRCLCGAGFGGDDAQKRFADHVQDCTAANQGTAPCPLCLIGRLILHGEGLAVCKQHEGWMGK